MSKHTHDLDHDLDRDQQRAAADDLVIVHGDGLRVDRADTAVARAQVRHRFGGVDPVAIASGAMAGLGAAVALLALASAAASPGLEQLGDRTLTIGALALGLALTALAFAFGGYVAGRVARYEGARNGLLAGLVLLVALCALGAGAAAFDVVRDAGRPSWVDTDLAVAAGIAAAGTAVLALLLSLLAGRAGAAWHSKVDRTLLGTRSGSLLAGLGEHR